MNWSCAFGLSNENNHNGKYNCPCYKYTLHGEAPSAFVGLDYY